jgi:hypothetical protein
LIAGKGAEAVSGLAGTHHPVHFCGIQYPDRLLVQAQLLDRDLFHLLAPFLMMAIT